MGQAFETAADALNFIRAGRAVFTLRSLKSGQHFTYKAAKAEDKDLWFVSLKTGPEYEDMHYIGILTETGAFRTTAKSKVSSDAPSVKALAWALARFTAGEMPTQLECWHEGKCGRCNRPLTVPSSIRNGIGPECMKHSGFVADSGE